jgi:hypothetical protein
MGEMDNQWGFNAERSVGDPDGIWMTTSLEDGWRLHVRLVTNGYRTVMDQLHVEPGETTSLHGLRGVLELPTGDPAQPTWSRVSLHSARRDATARLNQLLTELRKTQARRYAATTAAPDTDYSERREQLDQIFAIHAEFKGFTLPATKPRVQPSGDRRLRLALVAVAYEHARIVAPTRPRAQVYELLRRIGRHYALSSIGPLIHQARDEGMLTREVERKASGKATQTARTAIREAGVELPWESKE